MLHFQALFPVRVCELVNQVQRLLNLDSLHQQYLQTHFQIKQG
jgi:hypothetical protein